MEVCQNFENLGFVIENDRDRNIAKWLVKEVGPERVKETCAAMTGKKWPTSVAKRIGILLPDGVYNPQKAQVDAVAAAQAKAGRDRANLEKLRAWRSQWEAKKDTVINRSPAHE